MKHTDDTRPCGSRSSAELGPTLRRLRMYLAAYASGALMLPGWIAGMLWHRMRDGWNVAKLQLDRLDDAVVDDMAQRERRGPRA